VTSFINSGTLSDCTDPNNPPTGHEQEASNGRDGAEHADLG